MKFCKQAEMPMGIKGGWRGSQTQNKQNVSHLLLHVLPTSVFTLNKYIDVTDVRES